MTTVKVNSINSPILGGINTLVGCSVNNGIFTVTTNNVTWLTPPASSSPTAITAENSRGYINNSTAENANIIIKLPDLGDQDFGDFFWVVNNSVTAAGWTIQNSTTASTIIRVGGQTINSTTGGTLSSNAIGSSICLLKTAPLSWIAISFNGVDVNPA